MKSKFESGLYFFSPNPSSNYTDVGWYLLQVFPLPGLVKKIFFQEDIGMQVSQYEENQILQNLASKVTSAESEGDQNLICTPTLIQTDSFEEEMKEEGYEACNG